MKNIIITTVCFCAALASFAQGERVWNNHYYAPSINDSAASLWIDLEIRSASNYINNKTINSFLNQKNLSSENTDYVLDWDAGKALFLMADLNSNISFRTKSTNKWRLTINAGIKEELHFSSKTDLVQLLLRGNGPFEDQTLNLGLTTGEFKSSQYFGVGTEFKKGEFILGGSINLEKIGRYQRVSVVEPSTVYTAPFGTQISGELNTTYWQTSTDQDRASAWYGTGVFANVYLNYSSSDNKVNLYLAVNNLGAMFFGGINVSNIDTTFNFEGYNLDDYQNFNAAIDNPNPSELENFIDVTDSNYSVTILQPSNYDLRFSYRIKEKWALSATFKVYGALIAPQAKLAALYQPNSWLSLEPSIKFQTINAISPGLSASLLMKEKVQLLVKTEQFSSLIAPQDSHAQMLFIGAQLLF
jgi:hypothetical protein